MENCCFEGGGILGLAYVGVLKALEEKEINFKKFIGSSAGSIFAGLISCGADSKFLEKVVETDFTLFMDYSYYLGQYYNFVVKGGLYKGDFFYNWYGDLLKELTGNADYTFKDLIKNKNIELTITSTNLNERRTYFLNFQNYPDMPIRQAVRMSMSIPLFFEPVFYKDEYWVDGGFLDNFAYDYFSESPSHKTIGFKFCGEKQECYNINSWADYLTNILESSCQQIENLREKDLRINCITIPTKDVQPTDFGISQKTKEELIQAGYSQTIKFFE